MGDAASNERRRRTKSLVSWKGDDGESCLMAVLVYLCNKPDYNTKANVLLQFLLDAAGDKRCQLLQIKDRNGANVFHYVETDAQVQTVLGGLDRAGQCPCQLCEATRKALKGACPDLPEPIRD